LLARLIRYSNNQDTIVRTLAVIEKAMSEHPPQPAAPPAFGPPR
jgi:hypothetical protein